MSDPKLEAALADIRTVQDEREREEYAREERVVTASVYEAVANTLDGMGVREFLPHASLAQRLAFQQLIDKLRERSRL